MAEVKVGITTECRSCQSTKLIEILDLGEQYTSDFRDDDSKPPRHPIVALLCESCKLVQLKHTTPASEMYHENYGFKSGISDSIKADLREIVQRGLSYRPDSWLDIASNDGTLLSFVPKEVYRVGVDPIKKLCEEAQAHADVIVNDFFKSEDQKFRNFDIITSISCFYDMDDPNAFVADVKKVLAKDGVWIIQQNYLKTTMELGAVDNFCHEHLEYYTLLSLESLLERHDLEVIRVETSMVNGGSLRTYVARRGARDIDESVRVVRLQEADYNLKKNEPYLHFADNAKKNLYELHKAVLAVKKTGRKVYVLAASTRGSTIWQAAKMEHLLDKAVERNPAKVGKYFSAIGIPIISEEQAREDNPGAMVVGPWFFADEIIERESNYLDQGGKLILPLPTVKVVKR